MFKKAQAHGAILGLRQRDWSSIKTTEHNNVIIVKET